MNAPIDHDELGKRDTLATKLMRKLQFDPRNTNSARFRSPVLLEWTFHGPTEQRPWP